MPDDRVKALPHAARAITRTRSGQTDTHFHDTGQVNALKRKIK